MTEGMHALMSAHMLSICMHVHAQMQKHMHNCKSTCTTAKARAPLQKHVHNCKGTCTSAEAHAQLQRHMHHCALHLGVAVVEGGPIPTDPPPLEGITVDTVIGRRLSFC